MAKQTQGRGKVYYKEYSYKGANGQQHSAKVFYFEHTLELIRIEQNEKGRPGQIRRERVLARAAADKYLEEEKSFKEKIENLQSESRKLQLETREMLSRLNDQQTERKFLEGLSEEERRKVMFEQSPLLREFAALPLRDRTILAGKGKDLYSNMDVHEFSIASQLHNEARDKLKALKEANRPAVLYTALVKKMFADAPCLSDSVRDVEREIKGLLNATDVLYEEGKLMDYTSPNWNDMDADFQQDANAVTAQFNDVVKFWEERHEEYFDISEEWNTLSEEERAQEEIRVCSELMKEAKGCAQLEVPSVILIRLCGFATINCYLRSRYRLAVIKELKKSSVSKTLCFVNKEGQVMAAVKPILSSQLRAEIGLYLSTSRI